MKKILIINANYYNEITNILVKAAIKTLKNEKLYIKVLNVSGVFEIPISIRNNINKFDGFIALGCVIKGNTPHFDLICRSVFDSILNLSTNFNKPITNGIITAFNKKQAYERCSKIRSSKANKGVESARAIISFFKNGTKKI